ncbi:MAG: TonB-dependent receptor [Gammaproteobacteria bacterium]|nr:TonB-dependent receptor [Gammaproteobacteria bacterium]
MGTINHGTTLAAIAVVSSVSVAYAAPLPDEIVVTATRDRTQSLDLIGNTAKLPEERIRLTNHQHINELGVASAGTWLVRANGQENLTAIRSPVLTGPGACGAFLILEDSIPTRPTGFCNVNELLEVPSEISQAVETIRGPSNALYGSNGLHGTMNILLPEPGTAAGWLGSATVGPNEFYRGKLGWDGSAGRRGSANFGLLVDHYGGFRDDSGYEQQKAFGRFGRSYEAGELGLSLSVQNLDQETAGYIRGKDAYRDPELRRTNPNPEAFRKANSQRLSARWRPTASGFWSGADLRFYLRRSDMEFLQHFIPGQPLEQNGQVSTGMIWTWLRPWRSAVVTAGLDLEYMDGFIKQYQAEPLEGDSAFLNETLPQGWHYDFDVAAVMVAPYGQIELPLAEAWKLILGLRVEYLRYDYDNKLLDGNTRDDGTPCGFGGCRYSRPGDRSDDFLNVAPNVGVSYEINAATTLFATLSRGFRAPQVTELYRLQNNQNVADLDSVTIDSLEAGVRWQTDRYRLEATGFAMVKRNDIFQDADRNNISDGRTKHVGVEAQAEASYSSGFYASLAATWARHTYDFDLTTTGDSIRSGNDIDTAPRTLGSLRLGWNGTRALAEIEGVHVGAYYLDASNAHEYGGYNLLNARAVWRISDDWSLTGRINNILDTEYADRGDFAFGSYRYLPGRPREFLVEIAYKAF